MGTLRSVSPCGFPVRLSPYARGRAEGYPEGPVVSEAEQGIVPKGSTVTEFHIRKPDGWPSGKYQVTVTLNNEGSKATKTIKVL